LSVSRYIRPFKGFAVRHIPDIDTADVRDFRYCAQSDTNRWNSKGEPTLYLAKDKSVAIGEFARHFKENRSSELADQIHRRQIWKLSVELIKILDLCNLDACRALSLTNAPRCFENIQVARSTASFLRNTLAIEAIFVPSMVFTDDLSKWCLVVFLENLPRDSMQFFPEAKKIGRVRRSLVTNLVSTCGPRL
jgi:RES domain-containing protein